MASTTTASTEKITESTSSGMPQLDFTTFANQIFWLIVTLLILYFILSRIVIPRIADVLAERRGTISNDIAAAEELKVKAEEAEAAYNLALADARIEAAKIIEVTKTEMKDELRSAIAEADKEIFEKITSSEKQIAEIRASAMDKVEQIAKTVAAEIVISIGGDAQNNIIEKAIAKEMKV